MKIISSKEYKKLKKSIFDDFKEFDEEQIDDIINFLFSKRSDE